MEVEIRRKYSSLPGMEAMFPIEDFMTFFTKDGLRLHTYKYPARSPRCLVISFHGLHAYSNNSALVCRYLSEVGCEVIGFDQRGHGKSEGPPGLIPSFDILLDDSYKFVKEITALYQDLPVFLIGGSMGGCLCINLNSVMPGKFKGLILMSPAIKTHSRFEGCLRGLFRCLASCCPGAKLVRPNLKEVFSNQEQIDYLEENPYSYTGRVRLGSLSSLLEGMRRARAGIEDVRTSFVVIHGTNDKVVNPEWSQYLYINAPSKDKSIWMYSGLGHALVFEKEIYEISERISKWLFERLDN